MAVQWQVLRLPISTEEDFNTIVSELNDREENAWDLEYVVQSNGALIMFFKQKE